MPHTYGAGQAGVQLRIAHTPVLVQRRAPPQSGSELQLRWQAPNWPQSVPLGQSLALPQPLQMPPGADAVQVD